MANAFNAESELIDPGLATAVLKHATENGLGEPRFDPALDLKLIDFVENARSDLGDLSEMTSSIVIDGVRQPISVIENGGRYDVWLGHRRTEASRRAGRETIPALIYASVTPTQFISGQLVENLIRADMDEKDIFSACVKLEEGGMTRTQIAQAIGKSPGMVTIYLSPKEAHSDVLSAFLANYITLGHVYKCNKSPKPLATLAIFRGGATREQAAKQMEDAEEGHDPEPESTGQGKSDSDAGFSCKIQFADKKKIVITGPKMTMAQVVGLLATAHKEAAKSMEDGLTVKSWANVMADRAKKPAGEAKKGKGKAAAKDIAAG